MTDQLRRAFDRAHAASAERQYIRGRLGRRNRDGSYSMGVPDRPGFVYVTLTGEGTQTVDIALNPFAARLVNLPVKMKRVNGILVIKEIDDAPGVLEAYLDGGIGAGVGPHTHRTGSGLEYEMESFWLDPGRVLWSGTGVTVRIRPFFYRYHHAEKYFAGGTLDLTSNLPATANKWAWVVVGVNPATNAAVAVTGAEQDSQADLLDSLIADVNMLDYIPLAAVQAQNGDTALSAVARYRDARHWLDERFRLDDLTNVAITSPVDTGVLQFDDASDTWVDGGAKQPLDDDLTEIAALDNADDQMLYSTGSPTAAWALATLTAFARSLLDDADAATARSTLGLGTMALEAAAAYLLLAGRAGGQTAYGGTGSGENAILNSTAHATKGEVKLANDGGNVTVRRSAAAAHTVHIGGSGVTPELALESNAGRKFGMGALDSGLFLHFGSYSNHDFSIVSNNTRRAVFRSTGQVGLFGTGSNFTPTSNLSLQAGTSADHANVGGILSVNTSAVGNVGTGEDNLLTFSVPANTLAANGDSLWFEAAGFFANNGNNKTVRGHFGTSGTTGFVQIGPGAFTAANWFVRGRIFRSGATSQVAHGVIFAGGSIQEFSVNVLDQTLSGAVTLRITGEGVSDNDLVCNSLVVGWSPANS